MGKCTKPETLYYNGRKRCGAKSKTTGKPCLHHVLNPRNGRCKFHGGKCTGPKTKAGKKRASQNNLKDGKYTVAAFRATAIYTKFIRNLKSNTKQALILLDEKDTKEDIE